MHTRIKKLRKSLDLTQQKFADALGIKQTTVASYEIGRIVPSDSTIKLICREFDVNEDWLRTGEGEMFVLPSRDDQMASHYSSNRGRLVQETLCCCIITVRRMRLGRP